MAIQPTKYIWKNGELIAWEDATEHVLSHALNYGTCVFEGIRSYSTPVGPAIFRLGDHIRRLFESARIYRIDVPFDQAQVCDACRTVIADNELQAAYIRPLIYVGFGELTLGRTAATPNHVVVGAFPWDNLHGADSLSRGINVCVSSWQRTTPASEPMLAKAGGHYLNSQLITMEAKRNGYDEGIAVVDGYLSEGAGENLFLVRDGIIYTPPLSSSILAGITRDTVFQLAANLGLVVRQEVLPREMLYLADEIFMTGTAAEISPVRSVDQVAVGKQCPGPLTQRLQSAFFGLFNGQTDDIWKWLDVVAPQPAKSS